MSVTVENFGCRLNIAEGEAIRRAATGGGAMTVINSCVVTSEAARQARQAIRQARRARPGDRIILTGCGADVERDRFAAMPEVDAVVANTAKRSPASYVAGAPAGDNLARPVVSGRNHARAFVEVQNGCDHRCTFCIIPFGRGDSRSIPADAVVETITELVDGGQKEVVLTGVDLTDYRGGLGGLVERILRDVPALPRLRLSSLDPAEIDPLLFELLTQEPRMMPHVHLSMQSGDDMILKRMKRRHTVKDMRETVTKLKETRTKIAIGADIIAGFPTESEAMFANSLNVIADCGIVFGHIFPYSPRPGTPAARMPQVAPQIAKLRAAKMREAVARERSKLLLSMIGSVQSVLVERNGTTGHAANFTPVSFPANQPGAIAAIRIMGSNGTTLTGIPV